LVPSDGKKTKKKTYELPPVAFKLTGISRSTGIPKIRGMF
jgi:hypothetical protein